MRVISTQQVEIFTDQFGSVVHDDNPVEFVVTFAQWCQLNFQHNRYYTKFKAFCAAACSASCLLLPEPVPNGLLLTRTSMVKVLA